MHTTYVYILQQANKKLAVGYTDDIRRDIFARHQESPEGAQVRLVYYETMTDQRAAIDRFIELKRLPKSKQQWLVGVFNPMHDDLSREWLWGQPGPDSQVSGKS